MKFIRLHSRPGDVLQISEEMSLQYEQIAEDLSPVWVETPELPSNLNPEEGEYVCVSEDMWFVFDDAKWRIMDRNEQQEARRQEHLGSFLNR